MDKVRTIQVIRYYVEEQLPEMKDVRRLEEFEERSTKRFLALEIARKVTNSEAPTKIFLRDFIVRMRKHSWNAHPRARRTYQWSAEVAEDIYDILMGMGGL